MNIDNWSTNPANNTLIGDINWSEGQLPSTVNNSARQMMADVASWRDYLYGSTSPFAIGRAAPFGGDINNLVQSGMYRMGNPTNAPENGGQWGQLLVVHGGQDTIAQIYFHETNGLCWVRTGNPASVGGSGVWSGWRLIIDNFSLAAAIYDVNGAQMRRNGQHLYGPDNLTNLSQLANGPGYITTDGRAYPRKANGGIINFDWSDGGAQPSWVWGGNDGTNMRVYNPSNFSVNYANGAGNADTVDGYHAADLAKYADFSGQNEPTGYCHLPGGRILQWATMSIAEDSYFTFTFPLAMNYCGYAAAEGMGEVGNGGAANNNPRIYNWSGATASGYNPQTAMTIRCFAIGYL